MKKLILLILLIPSILFAGPLQDAHKKVIAALTVADGGDACVTDATILGVSSGDTVRSVDYRVLTSKYTAQCTGTVKSIVFHGASLLSEDVKAAIYTDSGTEPNALVANSAIEVSGITTTDDEDVTLTYTGTNPSITKNTIYWVVLQADDTYWEAYASDSAGGDLIRYDKTYADAMPADFDAQGYTKYTYTSNYDLRIRLVAE